MNKETNGVGYEILPWRQTKMQFFSSFRENIHSVEFGIWMSNFRPHIQISVQYSVFLFPCTVHFYIKLVIFIVFCSFSMKIEHVTHTNIYRNSVSDQSQWVEYFHINISNNRLLEPKNELMGRFQLANVYICFSPSCYGAAVLWLCVSVMLLCLFVLHLVLFLTRNLALRFYCLLSFECLILFRIFSFLSIKLNRIFPWQKPIYVCIARCFSCSFPRFLFLFLSFSKFEAPIEMMAFFTNEAYKTIAVEWLAR